MEAGVFCQRVLAKSSGNTHVTPTIPAMLAFMIRGRNLAMDKQNASNECLIQILLINRGLPEVLVCSRRHFHGI